jgi:uncharacterized membrane protein YeiH
MSTISKIKDTTTANPIGVIVGAIGGYMVAKKLGYDKTIAVISFTVVGAVLGGTIGNYLNGKIDTNKNKEFIIK